MQTVSLSDHTFSFSSYFPSCLVIYLKESGGERIVTFTTHRDTWEFLSRNRKQLKSGNLRGP